LTATTSTPSKGSSDAFTATVSYGSGSMPTGSVQFNVDGVASGSAIALSNATAQFVTSFSTAGPHNVGAVYSGDTTHASSTSSAYNVNVPYTTGSIPGTYAVTITGTNGTLSHTALLTLEVQ
jgi:hypothetical protein